MQNQRDKHYPQVRAIFLMEMISVALGYDQVHQEKFITDGCKKINLNVKVARLQSPVPEISSSNIEKEYGEAIHDI